MLLLSSCVTSGSHQASLSSRWPVWGIGPDATVQVGYESETGHVFCARHRGRRHGAAPGQRDILLFSPTWALLQAASLPYPKAPSGLTAVGQSPHRLSGLCCWWPGSPTPFRTCKEEAQADQRAQCPLAARGRARNWLQPVQLRTGSDRFSQSVPKSLPALACLGACAPAASPLLPLPSPRLLSHRVRPVGPTLSTLSPDLRSSLMLGTPRLGAPCGQIMCLHCCSR